jgi:excisionase family DNA binding protein
VAAQPSGKAAPDLPRYLHTAEVADILHVSPKTVSRWAKEGKLPFLKTLGGHRRYPAAEIRQLADELQGAADDLSRTFRNGEDGGCLRRYRRGSSCSAVEAWPTSSSRAPTRPPPAWLTGSVL